MAKFWCVVSKFFDSGAVKAICFAIDTDEKPQNGQVENRMCDEYRDYFDTYEEAKQYERDCYNA